MDKHEVTVKYSAAAPDEDVAGAGDEIVPATEVVFAIGADAAPFKVGLFSYSYGQLEC